MHRANMTSGRRIAMVGAGVLLAILAPVDVNVRERSVGIAEVCASGVCIPRPQWDCITYPENHALNYCHIGTWDCGIN